MILIYRVINGSSCFSAYINIRFRIATEPNNRHLDPSPHLNHVHGTSKKWLLPPHSPPAFYRIQNERVKNKMGFLRTVSLPATLSFATHIPGSCCCKLIFYNLIRRPSERDIISWQYIKGNKDTGRERCDNSLSKYTRLLKIKNPASNKQG